MDKLTILGMGRGAGNVDTNQLVSKLNTLYRKKYDKFAIKKVSNLYFSQLKKNIDGVNQNITI